MNVAVESIAACRKKLSIEVPADEVARQWKDALVEFQKYAAIPGFRAGHAPASILEQRFQKEISAEVQRKLIPQSFREAVAKEKLRLVSMPAIEEVKFSKSEPLHFSATIDIEPEFQLPEYKGLKIKKSKVSVKEEDIENAIKILAEQQATFADIKNRGLALGDFAVISYSGVCEGKPIAEIHPSAKPLSENKHFWLLVAKDSFLPGFCEPLLGANVGEKKQVLITFPKDFQIKELSNKKATYFVDILGMKEKKMPPLDDAFATKYHAANMADLKKKIEERLYHDREHQVENEARNQMIDQLLKGTVFDLPESMVNNETRQTMQDIVRENQMRGVGEDKLREKGKEILDSAHQSAKDKVRVSFILNRIAEKEKVEVKNEELQERIRSYAEQAGKPIKEFTQQLETQGEVDSLRQQILIEHTLDLLISHAIVETE